MHPTQLDILDSLRQGSSRKFSELLSDVAETSDNLTYHLKRLLNRGLVESPVKGEYALAPRGIVYLNNNLELNHNLFPTVSCMLELQNAKGEILVMQKLKQPYLGSLHLLTFGITSDQSLQKQIAQFLEKYHIKAGNLAFKCTHRERVKSVDGFFIFDKFFVVFKGRFTSFSSDVADRRFIAAMPSTLIKNGQTLSASKAVLELTEPSGFTESTKVL